MFWRSTLLENTIVSILLVFLVVAAATAISFRNVLNSVLALSVFSITLAVLFVLYQAPDAAMAEAVVGAGLVMALFLVTISKTRAEEEAD